MTKDKKVKSNTLFIPWKKLAEAYLVCAKLCILELTDKFYQNAKKIYGFDTNIFEDRLILIPAVWSISHALELFLKTLSIRWDDYYLNREHDKNELLQLLKSKIDENKLNNISDKQVENFEKLIIKYRSLSFWDNKLLKSQNILDINNSALRYPETDINFVLPLEIFPTVTEQEIQELKNDIISIDRLYGSFHSAITNYKMKTKMNNKMAFDKDGNIKIN